jgi:plastocyanin
VNARQPLAAAVALGALLLAATAAPAADTRVIQKDRKFAVRQLTIKVGDSVTFVNADDVNHNVYSEAKGAEFDLVQPPGSSQTVKFAQPGRVEVQCAIHRAMQLNIQVNP